MSIPSKRVYKSTAGKSKRECQGVFDNPLGFACADSEILLLFLRVRYFRRVFDLGDPWIIIQKSLAKMKTLS